MAGTKSAIVLTGRPSLLRLRPTRAEGTRPDSARCFGRTPEAVSSKKGDFAPPALSARDAGQQR